MLFEWPRCSGYYDSWNGEYDCHALHSEICEDCLCLFDQGYRGLWNPDTGKKWSYARAYLYYNMLIPVEQFIWYRLKFYKLYKR